jgi:hypothetical protein
MYEKYTVYHTLTTIHTYIGIHTVHVFVTPFFEMDISYRKRSSYYKIENWDRILFYPIMVIRSTKFDIFYISIG